jgi:hypothetical protein
VGNEPNPTDFTPHLKLLFWAFALVFTLLVGYLLVYAWRLTRRKNKRQGGRRVSR